MPYRRLLYGQRIAQNVSVFVTITRPLGGELYLTLIVDAYKLQYKVEINEKGDHFI